MPFVDPRARRRDRRAGASRSSTASPPSARTWPAIVRYEPVEVDPRRLDGVRDAAGRGRPRRRRRRPRPTARADRRARPRQRGPRALPVHRVVAARTASPRGPRRRRRRRRVRRRRGRPVDAGPGRPPRRRGRRARATASAPRSASRSSWVARRGGRPRRGCSCSSTTATRPRSSTTRSAAATAPCAPTSATRPRRPVPPRRPPGPDRPRRRHRRRARRARPPGSTTSARRPRPSSSSGLGAEDLLGRSRPTRRRRIEAYLEVRSALVRLLDPAAMGRFRVMAFGRGWPAGAAARRARLPTARADRRTGRRPTAEPHRTRANALLPRTADRHASRSGRASGHDRRGAEREPARALGALRSPTPPRPGRRPPASVARAPDRPHC